MDTEKTMDTEQKETKTKAKTDDRVDVFIPRGGVNEEPNKFVGINGVNYILPRGKTSKVPRYVADEINRSIKALQTEDENIERMSSAAQ